MEKENNSSLYTRWTYKEIEVVIYVWYLLDRISLYQLLLFKWVVREIRNSWESVRKLTRKR